MKTLEEYFEEKKNTPSDINEHLETFRRYANECDTIVEMGVRAIVSTWAFLMGGPKKMISIDLTHPENFGGNIDEVYRVAQENNIDYEFKLSSTLSIDIEECDLLFIDTWHDFLQLKQELHRHHKKVKKYILFHDTEYFGFKNETIYEEYHKEREETNLPKGLVPAINEFCIHNPEWFIHEKFSNNNGITVLKKHI